VDLFHVVVFDNRDHPRPDQRVVTLRIVATDGLVLQGQIVGPYEPREVGQAIATGLGVPLEYRGPDPGQVVSPKVEKPELPAAKPAAVAEPAKQRSLF